MNRNITFFELICTTFILREGDSSHQPPGVRLAVTDPDLIIRARER